jgi:hypothetical protein
MFELSAVEGSSVLHFVERCKGVSWIVILGKVSVEWLMDTVVALLQRLAGIFWHGSYTIKHHLNLSKKKKATKHHLKEQLHWLAIWGLTWERRNSLWVASSRNAVINLDMTGPGTKESDK